MTFQRWFSLILVCPTLFIAGVRFIFFSSNLGLTALGLLLISGPTLWALEGRRMFARSRYSTGRSVSRPARGRARSHESNDGLLKDARRVPRGTYGTTAVSRGRFRQPFEGCSAEHVVGPDRANGPMLVAPRSGCAPP